VDGPRSVAPELRCLTPEDVGAARGPQRATDDTDRVAALPLRDPDTVAAALAEFLFAVLDSRG
jgi:hypothetical protein